MSSKLQPLLDSLEAAAAAAPNIYELVFNRYFELCPESAELLQHSDELMRGRMMEQVMSLLMDEDVESLDVYFKFEVSNHEGYGALLPMYAHLFQACKEVTQANSDTQFSELTNGVWDDQIAVLIGLVSKYSSA